MKITVPSPNKIFFQGYYLAGTIPIGMKNNGLFPRHTYFEDNNVVNSARSFYSAKYPTLKGELLVTVDFKGIQANLPILVHLNLGGVFTLSQLDLHNTVITALAVEYSPLYFLDFFVDLHAESRFSNFSADVNLRNDPIYLSPGLKIKTPTGLYLTFAGDFSLSSNRMSDRLNWKPVNGGGKDAEYSTGVIPRYGVQFMFGWQGFVTVQDDDNDGINNTTDRCPKDAEDIDSFEDSDGCPDADNDHDGVIDLKDKCPNDAEDKDGFYDSDGCPDPDNDADGIEDLKDLCPNVTEDLDLFEDADGCPDLDNDKDGIVDTKDKCPNEVEDFDGFEDTDGCPELDNDKDGIIDSKDKCPNDAENLNNKEDSDGCPDTIVRVIDMPKQQLIKGVTFKNNSHEMSFESYEKFEPVIKLLKQYPEVSIEIRAHTDAVGNYAKNMQLSQMRAEAVRQYFISKAVEQERVRAVGMGSSNPLADNRTAAGRTQNRRVEILRIK
jgi:outer membrane protein OmpA-like peptidoglycan-associated protein